MKDIKDIKFPTEPYLGMIWYNPRNGWTYEFQSNNKGWVCIDEEGEE